MSYGCKFLYNQKSYPSKTKFIFTGIGYTTISEKLFTEAEIEWCFYENLQHYFKYEGKLYHCHFKKFEEGIIRLAQPEPVDIQPNKKEVVWTDGMVAATIWYILIMLFAIICNGRIAIWIIATIVWRRYIDKNKIEIWR